MTARLCVVALDWDEDELDTTIEWDYTDDCPVRIAAERKRAEAAQKASCITCFDPLRPVDGADALACVQCAVVYRAGMIRRLAGPGTSR